MKLADLPPTSAEASGLVPRLTVTTAGGRVAHIIPTVKVAAARKASGANNAGPLLYHAGGAIMSPTVSVYAIFWAPPTLQTGAPTGYTKAYGTVQLLLGAWMNGHGLLNIATQYYQTLSGATSYVQNCCSYGGYYVDTAPYPASGCADPATPGNCLTDMQIRAEIQRVMAVNGWTPGMGKIYLLYTSSDEGSCLDATGASCAYAQYCAYHSYVAGNPPIIYGVAPYANLNACYTGTPSPNGDPLADSAASTASAVIMEAVTDPLLNAWFDSAGNEIADGCVYNYGAQTWNNATANQQWNGFSFLLQQEWSNHASGCVQVGP